MPVLLVDLIAAQHVDHMYAFFRYMLYGESEQQRAGPEIRVTRIMAWQINI